MDRVERNSKRIQSLHSLTCKARQQIEDHIELDNALAVSNFQFDVNNSTISFEVLTNSGVEVLTADLTPLLGGILLTQNVNTFADLVDGNTIGEIAHVNTSTGIMWFPSYRPKGWYVWNGTTWISDKDAIVNQFDQILIDLTNKADLNHTHVKGDITDFNEADYATAEQGQKADFSYWMTLVSGYDTVNNMPTNVPGGRVFVYTYQSSTTYYRFIETGGSGEDSFYDTWDGVNKPTGLVVTKKITI